MIPPIFLNQSVVIVAGGPSLKGFDWRLLHGLNTIAINMAYKVVPDATVLWWTDARFWRDHAAALAAHPAPWKATTDWDYRPEDALAQEVHVYKLTGVRGFDPQPGCMRHGNNGAYAAMHLAARCGARQMILLGVDMKYGPLKQSHWHGGHGIPHRENSLTEHMLPQFASLKPHLDERGIEVLNASPNSALRVWPRCSIAEGLAAYGQRHRVSACN